MKVIYIKYYIQRVKKKIKSIFIKPKDDTQDRFIY
jgi:hypothetical protein